MPLLLTIHPLEHTSIGIWQVTENEEYFLNQISLFTKEKQEFETLNAHKRLEWVSSRYLLHLVIGKEDRGPCLKDSYGKPYIEGLTDHISLSHSGAHIATIVSPLSVGVDIQVILPKITRIAPKFISHNEYFSMENNISIEVCHVFWGAKEAMYKAYGRKELDFKKNILVKKFVYSIEGFEFEGQISKDNQIIDYHLECKTINNLILVYAIQK